MEPYCRTEKISYYISIYYLSCDCLCHRISVCISCSLLQWAHEPRVNNLNLFQKHYSISAYDDRYYYRRGRGENGQPGPQGPAGQGFPGRSGESGQLADMGERGLPGPVSITGQSGHRALWYKTNKADEGPLL